MHGSEAIIAHLSQQTKFNEDSLLQVLPSGQCFFPRRARENGLPRVVLKEKADHLLVYVMIRVSIPPLYTYFPADHWDRGV